MSHDAHISVLLETAVSALQVRTNEWYVDATFGGGGHTRKILQEGGKVVAFEWDEAAVTEGQKNFAPEIAAGNLILLHHNFIHLQREVALLQEKSQISMIQGILFDFGTSTQQLTSEVRGFSFKGQGPLDMRMDNRLGVQAKDILALIPEKQLTQLFIEFGGEEQARAIAKKIKHAPNTPSTIEELTTLILAVKGERRGRLHPATKVFQALRIAVNSELDNINQALPQAYAVVETGGRIVTIAFHEGEDKIAKQFFKEWEEQGRGTHLTKAVITPTEDEMADNPRSRSAKLRIFEKNKK